VAVSKSVSASAVSRGHRPSAVASAIPAQPSAIGRIGKMR
jgi:hypothetical protein